MVFLLFFSKHVHGPPKTWVSGCVFSVKMLLSQVSGLFVFWLFRHFPKHWQIGSLKKGTSLNIGES